MAIEQILALFIILRQKIVIRFKLFFVKNEKFNLFIRIDFNFYYFVYWEF